MSVGHLDSRGPWRPRACDLTIELHDTRRGKHSARCTLAKSASLPTEDGSTSRHFVLHYDDEGEPLLNLAADGGSVDGLLVSRSKDSSGAPYMLDAISVWWRATESMRFFPCFEWLDADEGVRTRAQRLQPRATHTPTEASTKPNHLGLWTCSLTRAAFELSRVHTGRLRQRRPPPAQVAACRLGRLPFVQV